MIFKKVMLTDTAYLDVYVADTVLGGVRDALLVIPGGGYACVCSEREGEPIAHAFMPYGYNAFVLHYSVGKKSPYPTQLIEASLAMKHIKDNAAEYNINPDRVFAIGFSAGAHLCGSLGIFWKRREVYDKIDMEYGYNKPKGVMLIYPVVSGVCFPHRPSFEYLLMKDDPTTEELEYVSLEKHTDSDSSPAFLVHTFEDGVVDVRNSLALAEAYKKANVPFEMHIYPTGVHGISLANEITTPDDADPHKAKWTSNAAEWAKSVK